MAWQKSPRNGEGGGGGGGGGGMVFDRMLTRLL